MPCSSGSTNPRSKSAYSWFSPSEPGSETGSDSGWEVNYFGEEETIVDDVDWWSKYYASFGMSYSGRVVF